jgi:hypothetical protein
MFRYAMSGKPGSHRSGTDGKFALRPPEPALPAGTA